MERDEIDERLRYDIGWQLWKMGFFKNSSWCECLIEAIAILVERPMAKHHIMKEVYQEVAKIVGTTYPNVIMRIARAIEVTFNQADDKILQELFGNSLDRDRKIPTNEELIVAVSEMFNDETRAIKLAGKHLRALGIPVRSEGYDYFKKALEIVIEDPEVKPQEIYCRVAEEFGSKPESVKVAMHRARKKAQPDAMRDYFGEEMGNSLPNTEEFLDVIRKRIVKQT